MAESKVKHEHIEKLSASTDGVKVKMEIAYSHGVKAATVSRNAHDFCTCVEQEQSGSYELDWDQKVEIAPTEIKIDDPGRRERGHSLRMTFDGLKDAQTLFALMQRVANGDKTVYCKFYEGQPFNPSKQTDQAESSSAGNGSDKAPHGDDNDAELDASPGRRRGRPRKNAAPTPGTETLV